MPENCYESAPSKPTGNHIKLSIELKMPDMAGKCAGSPCVKGKIPKIPMPKAPRRGEQLDELTEEVDSCIKLVESGHPAQNEVRFLQETLAALDSKDKLTPRMQYIKDKIDTCFQRYVTR